MKHPNQTVARQQDILAKGTREQIIAWLEWNDPNGVYSDEASAAEGLDPIPLEQARDYMRAQIEGV